MAVSLSAVHPRDHMADWEMPLADAAPNPREHHTAYH